MRGTLLAAAGVLLAGLAGLAGAGSALAAAPRCGTAPGPTGATAEASWSRLATDVGAVAGGASQTFHLTASITAPTGQSLSVPAGASVTLDLGGCDLTITSPSVSAAGISVPAGSSLAIEDTSTSAVADQGTLTVLGGYGATGGGGAGIGGSGGTAGSAVNAGAGVGGGTVEIRGGNITAIGGPGSTGGAGGAGIGGGGGGQAISPYFPAPPTDGGTGGAGGAVAISGGTVTATGGAGGVDGGGGAAIGGGGGGLAESNPDDSTSSAGWGGTGGAAGATTIDGGTLSLAGGPGGGGGGGGAAIGGGGGGEATGDLTVGDSGSGGAGGPTTIDAGQTIATGGAGGNATGGGSGIGGGGGAEAGGASPYTRQAGAGGAGSIVTIAGGSIGAGGGQGGGGGGGAAAIGGGGGGGATEVALDTTVSASGGTGNQVTLSGGQLSAPAGASGEGGAGIGGGTGGGLTPSPAAAGPLVVVHGTGGTPSLTGEVAGDLTIYAAAALSVPAGGVLVLDSSSALNQGTIHLSGQLAGSGFLENAGAITVAGSEWSADGHGPAATPGATVAGNAFELSFHVASGTAPAAMWVFAPTLSAAGESLPGLERHPGYQAGWRSGQVTVGPTTAVAALASAGVVTLTAGYARRPTIGARLSSRHPRNRHSWWRAPVRIVFTCGAPSGTRLVRGCPAPVVLSQSGRGLRVSRTIEASNGATATATVGGIDIDLHRPNVKITGPRNHATYSFRAPRARCRAAEQPSGVASCKLATTKTSTRYGYRETVTATATTRAGVSRTVRRSFSVRLVQLMGADRPAPGHH